MTEFEIIANPEDYGIDALVEGLAAGPMAFPSDERKQWAVEIGAFAERLQGLSAKAKGMQVLLDGQEAIKATPASLKTLKIQLFRINDSLNSTLALVNRIENEIVPR